MTASEFQRLESHSDATVCSGLYAKTAVPMWSTKKHASKLLKGVLISRTLNNSGSTESQESSSAGVVVRGKRAFSTSSESGSNTSAVTQKTSTVKTTCLCAPTKHAGSFRCRLHRVTQKHWDGRQIHHSASSSSNNTSIATAANEISAAHVSPVASAPANCLSRTTAARPSRLRMVVVAAQASAAADDLSDAPELDDPGSLSESSVKYIKVATSATITQDAFVNESGGAATVSRKLHTSS